MAVEIHANEPGSIVGVRCPFCGAMTPVAVPDAAYRAWAENPRQTLIQDALPMLSADERELLLNGVCAACYPPEPTEYD